MSWPVLLILAIGTLALKAAGPLVFARRPMPAWLGRTVGSLPLAIYPALVASAALGTDGGIEFDERAIAAGTVLLLLIAFRRSMFGAAMIIGAAIAALIRHLAG